jgi:uncharacterized membrane protein
MDREQLAKELATLERDGVLDARQREVVLERLLPHFPEPKDGVGRFIAIIGMLGAVLIAAGILMFFAANWEDLPKWFKLALIFGSIATAHHYGFYFAEEPGRSPRIGHALTAIGVLLFGAAFGLIAQIYHLTSQYPWMVLVWSITSLPFALLTRSRAIFAIVVLLFFTWLGVHVGTWLDEKRFSFDREWVAAYATLGIAMAAVLKSGIAHLRGTRFGEFGEMLRLFSAPCVIAGVYAASFHDVFDDRTAPAVEWLAMLPGAIAAAVAAPLLALAARRAESRTDALDGAALILAFLIVVAVIQYVPVASTIVTNVLLFVGLLALITRGVQLGVPAYVNYGILGFLVAVITRYFEYLSDHMNPFLLFLGAGVLLLGFGFELERRRRAWISEAKEKLR